MAKRLDPANLPRALRARLGRSHKRARLRQPWLQGIVALLLVPVLSLVSRIRVRGRERLPAEGGFILAPNHPSTLDPLFAALPVLPRRLHFMGMAELWRKPVPAWIMSRVGGFPIVRGSWDPDAFTTAASVLERGRVLVVFPEGGVSPEGGYRPAKPGSDTSPTSPERSSSRCTCPEPASCTGRGRGRRWW